MNLYWCTPALAKTGGARGLQVRTSWELLDHRELLPANVAKLREGRCWGAGRGAPGADHGDLVAPAIEGGREEDILT